MAEHSPFPAKERGCASGLSVDMYGQSQVIPVGVSGVIGTFTQGAPQHQAHGVRGLHNAASKL